MRVGAQVRSHSLEPGVAGSTRNRGASGHAAYVVAYQTIVADCFGTRRFATIHGWIGMISSIGGAAGPLFGAWIYEVTRSYDLAFAIFAAVVSVGIPAMWLADRYRPVQEPANWGGAG